MKILHVIFSLAKGGAERYCLDVCTELSRRKGIEVLLLVMSPENSFDFLTKNINYKVCNSRIVPSISGRNIIETTEFDQVVKAFKPDIIHSHLFRAELLTHENIYPGVKYVTHCHDNMTELKNFSIKEIFKKRTYTQLFEKRWIIKRYKKCKNHFIVISKDSEQYYNKVLPRELRRIRLLHGAIDFERFHQANIDRTHTLGEINLLYTARFAIYKNHTFLVDVVEVLRSKGHQVHLNILGGGEQFNEVKVKAEQKNLLNEISFRGFVDNVEEYLKLANVYVHPAYYEPFGLVLLEAMAAGLPVVCLDGKGNRDLIENGKNGFMLFEQNANMFAEKILKVLSSKEKYREMVAYGSEYARRFDIKNHVDKLLTYYQSL